jgi:hypothetical protein
MRFQCGMLRDGSSSVRDQLRRSRSRSRGRVDWPVGPRDDGAGRIAPSQFAGIQLGRPLHQLERGDWLSPPDANPRFAELPRDWEQAELRGERLDPIFGFRRGPEHGQDFSPDHRGPRRIEDVLLPDREGRGRPDHGIEEWKGRTGPNPDEPRHKDLRALVSRRDGDRRGDERTAGGKGYDCACGILCT